MPNSSRRPEKATTRKKKAAKPSERQRLLGQIRARLGLTEEEAELRALRDLAFALGLLGGDRAESTPPLQSWKPEHGPLPQRLFLVLDGRMPIEVIEPTTTLGSGRKCTIWVNSPQIETRHLQITHGDEGWLLEDLGTEHGTYLGKEKIQRRVLRDGDEFRLAGYLRMRSELR